MFIVPNISILAEFNVVGPHWALMQIVNNSWILMHFDLFTLVSHNLGLDDPLEVILVSLES